jgi:hypothetical protein
MNYLSLAVLLRGIESSTSLKDEDISPELVFLLVFSLR